MESFLQDLRHSLRMFWQSRGFTAAAVAALALGIGLNTAIFSMVNAVLLKPPPFPEPERLVMFEQIFPNGRGTGSSPAKFMHWRAQSSVVQDAAGFRTGVVNLTGVGFPEQLRSGQVTADFFKLFGAPIVRGRSFTPQEDLPKAPKTALISEGLWKRRFGSDPLVIGRAISLGNEPHEVIGIVGDRFDFREFGPSPDIWVPFQFDPQTTDQGHYFQSAARLKPGVTLEQANARFKIATEDFKRKYPRVLQNNVSFGLSGLRESLTSNVRTTLWILIGAVSFVLLIACANVANLLLARAIGRAREIAIRAAVGAGRGRLVRQLLTESVLLAAAGALLGSALGILAMRALLLVNTANLPRIGEDGNLVTVDWRVLAFTAAVTLATSLLFGLIPALRASRPDLIVALKESAGRGGSGLGQHHARTLLVVSEIALAVILLIGAALLIRTSLALASVKPGYDTSHVLTMRMSLTGPRFATSAGIEQMVHDGVERLRAIPGVEMATAACCVPLEGGYGLPFLVVGRPLADGPFHGGGAWLTVSPGYFESFKIPIVRGRAFDERDGANTPPVVLINEAMAKQFWPKADPLRDTLWIGKGVMSELALERPRQVIGIVGNVRDGGLNNEPGPTMYVPNAQVPDALNALNARLTPLKWIVRTHGDPLTLAAPIQEQLRQVTGLPIRTMDDVVARSTSRQRFNMLLMSIFGGAALLLASIGVYALMAHTVQQRTPEIGIRMALGAQTSDVRRMVIGQGMRFAVAGVAAGVLGAYFLSQLIRSFLFGVEPWDPLVFVAVPVTLTAIALFAVWLPSRRATSIDPVTALRYE